MKALTNITAVLSLILSVVALVMTVAAPASAAVDLRISEAVRSAAGHGSSVIVQVDGDTVILSGFVEDSDAVTAIEEAAESVGAETVVNNVFAIN